MKIWITTKYGTSNITEFENYEQKEKFLKKRTDPEMIELIEKFKKNYNLAGKSMGEIKEFFSLKEDYKNLEYIPTENTPELIKKIFDKLQKNGISTYALTELEVVNVVGKKIKFEEYDGAEYIEIYDDMQWFLV